MKRHLISILASAAVAVAGCNETNETNAGGGCGTIRIACRTDLSIDAEAKASPKATRTEITAPDGSEFALRITGADFDRSWESVAAFEAEENVFAEGPYKIAVEHGDPETEGPDKPYFSGSTDIDVAARRVNTAQVTAHVAKSQTFVRITKAFAKFYHDAEFTVTTGSGNEFTFRPDGTGDPERIWVKTGTTLTVSGTAKPNERIAISTVPDGGSTIVNADANGKFSAELARTAGTYTEVSAQYVSDAASRVTLKGTFVVTGTVTKPGLEVDDLYNNSLTVVAKTTAGVTVYLKTGDYEQTLVADNRGIVRFTLPHTYAQGTRFTLTVYYGAGNSMSYNVEATVGGTPYYKLFKRGSRGDGVYALTSRLSEMGYPVSPTNYYSDSVAAAVRLFQSANGLSADGMAGKLTQEKLYSVGAISYSEGNTYPTLVRGDRGMALLYTLQQRLKDLGYYTIRVDGIFGSGTQRAVRWFQSVNGLSVTGKADNATQQLLYSAQAKAASGYSPESYDTLSRSNRYKAAVVPLQRRLKALGYLSGSADGYFGSNTYRAVRNFQSRNGLSVTGVADSGTQQLLYSSSARPASGSSSSGSGSSTGYRLLYWGCRGDAVKRLQQALIDAGYKSYVRSADGIYGQWTYDAVRAYQRDVGLSVDGIAGKNTQNKLYGTKY